MFNIIKLIRSKNENALSISLKNEVAKISEKWANASNFALHGQNGKFVKHLLSRITSYLDNLIGKDTSYETYHHPNGKQFEIEHIWANEFEQHRDEFDQEGDFQSWRNSIGALLLLPQGTNQSFNSDKYQDKLEHYIKENTYAQTLHPSYYSKNPNFLKSEVIKKLNFKAHPKFRVDDIKDRDALVQRICESLWAVEYFNS